MRSIFAGIANVTVAISASALAQGTGNASKGQMVFQQECVACHWPRMKSELGPSLDGVFGRKAGTALGFDYSQTMQEAASKGVVWNTVNLDKFLDNPKEVLPGTIMVHPGLRDAGQRADVIAYLETLKSQ
jgi:cytochrome c2